MSHCQILNLGFDYVFALTDHIFSDIVFPKI